MSEPSIAVGTSPDTQALIGKWTADGNVVESSYDGERWWHRRIAPEYIKYVNLPTNPINLFATIESRGTGAAERIGESIGDGHMVDSRPFAGVWLNQIGHKAGAR